MIDVTMSYVAHTWGYMPIKQFGNVAHVTFGGAYLWYIYGNYL